MSAAAPTPHLTYGRAAKLVNVYLKALFLPSFGTVGTTPNNAPQRSKTDAIHPPIDRILLDTLAKNDVGGYKKDWRKFHNIGWTKFDKSNYQDVLTLVCHVTSGHLWTIEQHWTTKT